MIYSFCFDCRHAKDGSRRQLRSSVHNQESFFLALIHFQNEYKDFIIESIKLLMWDNANSQEVVIENLKMPHFDHETGVGPEMLGWTRE